MMDKQAIEAIDLMYEAAKETERLAQVQLDQAADLFRLTSALHDLAHAPGLRSVS